ncbi:hypothetical protein K4L44_08820 [Halosquirtibacter laminarini]|uniref:Uncharacterized protein n=1 Tax=Halosquirtibacter laminarini TaxID=3374600 RepID=A0AC61NJJ1_9BACT|nr:hypothetical protein K4L44_08820 [Prolixibacteraceae bacterium]
MLTESEMEELSPESVEKRLKNLKMANRKVFFLTIYFIFGFFILISGAIHSVDFLKSLPSWVETLLCPLFIVSFVCMMYPALKVKEEAKSGQGYSAVRYISLDHADEFSVCNYSRKENNSNKSNFLYVKLYSLDRRAKDYEYAFEQIYPNEFQNNQHLETIERFLTQFRSQAILKVNIYHDSVIQVKVKKIPLEWCVKKYCKLPFKKRL